ncbi:DUF6266 family protein [Kaistella antarctica]|uniref:Uncharacterized protein n=1 Tax=Kaistella antarctica TaxID=266748 RepID=A0A448NRH0_9FLAO|nr:DUF6266 family protein [Kaistella antarctica]KEY18792.1 hypothetical protein HY04_09980 [Kaistella antarctica]SEW15376.1 hypothetical protein SAMN05421765_2739 [Kaistella antarctica]VEH99499.1 Uncharacterised protein [Kaistella antarctica]
MGKLIDSLLSGSSGTVGRLVVANVSGNEILRARPRKRTKAATAKQLLIQSRMTKSYDFMLPYKEFAKIYFGTRSGMKSPFNQAMTNVLYAFKLDYVLNVITPTYSEIEFARGSLLGAVPTGLTAATPLTFDLTWFENSNADPLRETDAVQLLYIAEGDSKPTFMENVAVRLAATVTIPLAPSFQGKTLHVWLAFRSADLKLVSLSSYAGTVLIT